MILGEKMIQNISTKNAVKNTRSSTLLFLLSLIISIILPATAGADGFVCRDSVRGIEARVYNYISPSKGTRKAAVMVLSDLKVKKGRQTIAVFRDGAGVLHSESNLYIGTVDLGNKETSRRGERLAGFRLGSIYSVILEVDHNYAQPIAHNDMVDGTLVLIHQTGDRIYLDMQCVRYLKSQKAKNAAAGKHPIYWRRN